ncbi:efflux RND transporter periplasmic adaptor subunit [Coxiella burnetii]|uniref:efflux RND transporter periplasmic adaptor subunit n=2 Tax=Coxiella burnetii TaxID=777 RepID=UPI001EDDA2F7|nr:efflux RND transporter periplasmic adaptor subunit [Coxiella burnetii]
MKKSTRIGIIAVILCVVVAAVFFRLSRFHLKKPPHSAPTSITAAEVIRKAAPLFLTTQGSIEASQSVTIQPQVSGVIKKIGFMPGQLVTVGQLLFEIDPTTYQAALVKAQANLAKDQAQLSATQKDAKRYQSLVKGNFVSRQQYDQIKAQLDEQLSTVKLDEAAIKQSEAELAYTQITAPITGKTGNVTIKEGDLVTSTSTQVLVTINQLKPIFVDFYLPQSYLSQLLQYQQKQKLIVKVYSENNKQLLDTGQLTFIDNTVNSRTGTILLKASMPNKNELLWPGESVRVKLIFAVEQNVLAIPTQAVQSDQKGQFVYLIKNNHAFITPIKVLRQIGKWTFVSNGLKEGDNVATLFPPNLQDKSPVMVTLSESPQAKS